MKGTVRLVVIIIILIIIIIITTIIIFTRGLVHTSDALGTGGDVCPLTVQEPRDQSPQKGRPHSPAAASWSVAWAT